MPVEALLLPHERVGIFRDLLTDSRMLMPVFLKSWVFLPKLLVLHPGRIPGQLLADFGMAIEEAIKAGEMLAGGIAVSTVLMPVETLLLPHERVGIFRDLLTDSRMLLKIFLKSGMFLPKLL